MQALYPFYGLREASNIMAYYFDSQRNRAGADFDDDLQKLLKGIPVQYVVNNALFYGHEFHVDNRVLIPRPETEELVDWIINEHKSDLNEKRILDIGTGSGCIIISLLKKLNNSQGYALDIDPKALEVCRFNADRHDIDLEFVCQDILAAGREIFDHGLDIIVCNPPYILERETDRMDRQVIDHEPNHAFFVEGEDPLVFYKTIIDNSSHWLNEGGLLYFETSDLYHEQLADYLKDAGKKYIFREDMQGKWRMLKVQY